MVILERAPSFGKGRYSYFLRRAKSTKKHALGRAKSCRWQVFVRRRPPKQGELWTEWARRPCFKESAKPCDPAVQNICRILSFNFRRFGQAVTCTTKGRFLCFEPVRKGSSSADARPVLYPKRMAERKLTGADFWWNLLLHVIFGLWKRQGFRFKREDSWIFIRYIFWE